MRHVRARLVAENGLNRRAKRNVDAEAFSRERMSRITLRKVEHVVLVANVGRGEDASRRFLAARKTSTRDPFSPLTHCEVTRSFLILFFNNRQVGGLKGSRNANDPSVGEMG